MKKCIYFTIVLLGLNLHAQVNTEKYRTPNDLIGLAGFLELSGTVETGNTDKVEIGLDSRLDWKTENSTTFFVFESDYEWNDGSRSSDNGLFHIRHVRKLIKNLSAEAFGQINYDKKLLIKNRELLGAGLRYILFETKKSDIAFGSAYMFEHENYDITAIAAHSNEVKVSRWSNYISYYFQFTEAINFGGVFYYQPMFSNFSDYRILFETSLTVGISKSLALSINAKLRNDSIPPAGLKATDTNTNFGIAYKF